MVEHVSKSAPKQRDPLSLDQLQRLLSTIHGIEAMHRKKSFHRKPLRDLSSPMNQLAIDIHGIFRRETAELNRWFMRKDGAFDRQLQAVAFDYPEFEAFKCKAISGLDALKEKTNGDFGMTKLKETVQQLPDVPSLSDIWMFLERYKNVYSAIEKQSNTNNAPIDAAKEFDEQYMKKICMTLNRQICVLPEVQLDLASPDASHPPIAITIPNQNNSYSYAMSVAAFSAGRGLQHEDVPPSVQNYITGYNGLTSTIIQRWSNLCTRMLEKASERHVDETALMQHNHFALGDSQNAELAKKIRSALPEIIARTDANRSRVDSITNQERDQLIKEMADYLGESVKTMREQNNGVAIKS